jgi:hypothetical protein
MSGRKAWNEKAPPKSIRAKGWRRSENAQAIPAILYPGLVSEADRRALAERTEPGKKAPAQAPLLADHQRGATSPLGGQAMPDPRWTRTPARSKSSA